MHTDRVIVSHARLEAPIAWRRELADIVINEDLLLLDRVERFESGFGLRYMGSKTVKVKVLDGLGLEHDLRKFSQKLCLKCLCHVKISELSDR